MGKKLRTSALVLVGLISIRLFFQIVLMFYLFGHLIKFILILIWITAHILSILWILKNKIFGYYIAITIFLIDLAFALIRGGNFGLGAGIYDLIIIYLSYNEILYLKRKNNIK